MSQQKIDITLNLNDGASAPLTAAMQKVTASTNNAADATKQATLSAKDAAIGFSGLAVTMFGTYLSFDRIEKAGVALDRANLMVQRSTQSLKSTTDDYNKALASGDPTKIADATAKLSIAQDALTVSQERAKISQDNENESIAQFGLMIVPTAITAIASLSKLSEGLPGAIKNLSASLGSLDISTKSLALSAGAAFGAFALGYTALNSLEGPMKTTAALIMTVAGACIAGAIAAYALWVGLTAGAAVPFIAAGLAAVGLAAAGLTILIKDATASTNTYADANNKAVDSLGNLTDAEKTAADAETTRYQTSLDVISSYWNDYLGLTKTSLSKNEDNINTYYQKEIADITDKTQTKIDLLNKAYQQELTDYTASWNQKLGLTKTELSQIQDAIKTYYDQAIQTTKDQAQTEIDALNTGYQQELSDYTSYWSNRLGIASSTELTQVEGEITQYYATQASEQKTIYDRQISDANTYYNDLISASMTGLNNLRAARSGDLDNLELKMLTQKTALEDAHNTGLLSEKEYQTKLSTLTSSYNEERSGVSDHYRLQELQETTKQTATATNIEQQRGTKLTSIKNNESNALLDNETAKNSDLTLATQEYHDVALVGADTLSNAIQTIQTTQTTAELSIIQQRSDQLSLAQTGYDAITITDKQIFNGKIAVLEQTKTDTILSINKALSDALLMARTLDEEAELTHQNILTAATKKGLDDRTQLNVDYINTTGNMTSGAVPETLNNGSWIQTGNTPNQTAITDTSAASNFRDTISKENAAFLVAFQTGKITGAQYVEAINYQKTRVPAFKDGIEGVTTGPTMFIAGEAGVEKVSIQPLNKSNSNTGAVTNNFSIPITIQGSVDQRTLAVLKNELKNVVIEATSSGAPDNRKKIRFGNRRSF